MTPIRKKDKLPIGAGDVVSHHVFGLLTIDHWAPPHYAGAKLISGTGRVYVKERKSSFSAAELDLEWR